MNSVKVLITDGNERPALAAVRSLAKKGFEVITGAETRRSICSVSRFPSRSFVYPSPLSSTNEFLKVIQRECWDQHVDILLPMTEITTHLILRARALLQPSCRLPFPDFSSFDIVSDKIKLLTLARELNIPIPETYFIEKCGDLESVKEQLRYPIVLKPARSRVFSENGWVIAGVRYANSFEELTKIRMQERVFREFPFILQEYIKGIGCGIFVLYDRGTPVTCFAHKRLREKPPTGGVSVLSESVCVDPELREYTERLLSPIGWHGVAMVEFKRCQATGTPYLMEVNGRFWGSLQLAIDAGVDFPYLLCQLGLGKQITTTNTYRIGIRSRWLLGDLDSLYLTLLPNGRAPFKINLAEKLRSIYEFARVVGRNDRFDVVSLGDPKPFLLELARHLRVVR